MKSFIAFALIVAVAAGAVLKPAALSAEQSQINQIIAAINSPSTDPATAVLLESMLLDTLGINPPAIVATPAIVDTFQPIAVGPAIVNHPVSVVDSAVAAPSPAVAPPGPVIPAPAPVPEPKQPLVQIIVNVGPGAPGPVAVDNVDTPVASPAIVPAPVEDVVSVVDGPAPAPVVLPAPAPAPVALPAPAPAPVALPAPALPEVVQVVDSVPEAVQVVDTVPMPVVIAPAPAINLPDILN